jgi:hypothetical protein
MVRKGRGAARMAQILIACAAVVGPSVAGAQIVWTNWTDFTPGSSTGTATGTITTSSGPITVSYTGQVQSGSQTSGGGGTQYFNPTGTSPFPATTYADGTTVPNGPGTNPGFIQLTEGSPSVLNTFTFSSPVNSLFFSIISMGQAGDAVTYTFSNAFTLATQGPGWWSSGCSTCLVQSGSGNNILTGTEGDGTLIFNGPITTLSFTSNPGENWHGFTVGAESTVPEPGSMALLGTGLIGLVPVMRKRHK